MILCRNILLHRGVGLKEAHHFLRLGHLEIAADIVGEHSLAESLAAAVCGNSFCPQLIKELLLQLCIVLSRDKDILLPFRDT